MSHAPIRQYMNEILYALLGSKELIYTWWSSPNKAFDGETPDSVYEKDPARVQNYLLCQFNGDYS